MNEVLALVLTFPPNNGNPYLETNCDLIACNEDANNSDFPFTLEPCITHSFLFLFCMKDCECEKLEVLFLKPHED